MPAHGRRSGNGGMFGGLDAGKLSRSLPISCPHCLSALSERHLVFHTRSSIIFWTALSPPLGRPHGEIGGGYRHLTDVSSLSPATGWYSSFALLMRYSNSRPLWKSCFSLPRRRRLDRSNVDISPTWNLCGAGSPGSAVQRVHLGTTLRHAGWRPQI